MRTFTGHMSSITASHSSLSISRFTTEFSLFAIGVFTSGLSTTSSTTFTTARRFSNATSIRISGSSSLKSFITHTSCLNHYIIKRENSNNKNNKNKKGLFPDNIITKIPD